MLSVPPTLRAGIIFYLPLLLTAGLLLPVIAHATPVLERLARRVPPWLAFITAALIVAVTLGWQIAVRS